MVCSHSQTFSAVILQNASRLQDRSHPPNQRAALELRPLPSHATPLCTSIAFACKRGLQSVIQHLSGMQKGQTPETKPGKALVNIAYLLVSIHTLNRHAHTKHSVWVNPDESDSYLTSQDIREPGTNLFLMELLSCCFFGYFAEELGFENFVVR